MDDDLILAEVDKAEILVHITKRFAKWQLPEEILFVDNIPKTSVGKIEEHSMG